MCGKCGYIRSFAVGHTAYDKVALNASVWRHIVIQVRLGSYPDVHTAYVAVQVMYQDGACKR
jgi:hypothetical protein